MQLAYIPHDEILLGSNVRGTTGDTTELQKSIEQHGLIQPLVVDTNGYLVHGRSRYAALKVLIREGVVSPLVPCLMVEPTEGDEQLALAQAIDNFVRKPLKPTEVAAVIRGMMLPAVGEPMPQHIVAQHLGMDAGESDYYLLLVQADEKVRARVDSGELSWSGWKKIARAPAATQRAVAELEKPTVKNIKAETSRAAGKDMQRMFDDESLIEQANKLLHGVRDLAETGPWGEDIADRLAYVLQKIAVEAAELAEGVLA